MTSHGEVVFWIPIDLPELPCILVRHTDGTEVWEPVAEYRRNPAPGSYAVPSQKTRLEAYNG